VPIFIGRGAPRSDQIRDTARYNSIVLAAEPFGDRSVLSSRLALHSGERYRDLLPIVYKRLAEEWGVHATHEDCVEYGRSVGNWPAFEDTPGALQYLKKYFKLVILSNVDNETFQASNRRLQVTSGRTSRQPAISNT
jgi:FMN phosphatase YigB (HAD superfamily)